MTAQTPASRIAEKLSLENVDAQFCSDWLKDQIRELLSHVKEQAAALKRWEDEDSHEAMACHLSHQKLAACQSALDLVEDMAKNGVRFDLNPTVQWHDDHSLAMEFLAYIKRIDESVRERASEAMSQEPADGGEKGQRTDECS